MMHLLDAGDESAERAAEFLRTVAHAGRLRIVCALMEGERSASDLARHARLPAPALSQQAAVLDLYRMFCKAPAGPPCGVAPRWPTRASIRPRFLIGCAMADDVKRKPAAPARQGLNWKGLLIKSAIAIALFNVLAGLVTCYFVMPKLQR